MHAYREGNPNMMSNFNLKSDSFSDISDKEIVNASQDVENMERFPKPLKQKDLDDLLLKGVFKNTEQKWKQALEIFVECQQNRKRIQPNADSFMFKDVMNMCDEEIDRCLSFFVAEVRNESGENYKPNSFFEKN